MEPGFPARFAQDQRPGAVLAILSSPERLQRAGPVHGSLFRLEKGRRPALPTLPKPRPGPASVVDDRAVSRYHLQLRLRFGRYTLFDIQSQGGTLVNEVKIKEHNLQTGDVIQIGNTRLVYMEDRPISDGQTQTNDPVEPAS